MNMKLTTAYFLLKEKTNSKVFYKKEAKQTTTFLTDIVENFPFNKRENELQNIKKNLTFSIKEKK